MSNSQNQQVEHEEYLLKAWGGMSTWIVGFILAVLSVLGIIWSATALENGSGAIGTIGMIVCICYLAIGVPLLFMGLKVVGPNEALVLTLFGKYYGTLKSEGFFYVNPFVVAVNPAAAEAPATTESNSTGTLSLNIKTGASTAVNRKISLKSMTLSNDKQKINDLLGNPIIIGIVVIWKVQNTAKAVFNVDNYREFLSIQCDSSLRNIVRLYPYDIANEEGGEKSLRGSSQEVAECLKEEIQSRVNCAGLEIIEARITHLAYAPEIAASMLQRQQASAIIDAKKMIVEGAVGMVELALERLEKNESVTLDEERKASMVSNLLVVLCGNKDVQPIVNSGSIY